MEKEIKDALFNNWELVKDDVLGTWEEFKRDLLIEADKKNLAKKLRSALKKALTEYEKEKGYADNSPVTVGKYFDIYSDLHEKVKHALPGEGEAEKIYDLMPQGPGTNFIKNFITNPNGELSRKNVTVEKRSLFTGDQVISYSSDKANYTISITNEHFQKIINISNRQGVNTRKVFNFLLAKANENNFPSDINFTLDEVVNRGIYKSKRAAYKGVKNCIDSLMGLQIEGVRYEGKKEVRNVKSYIFVARDINFMNCTVKTMPGLLEALCGYFSVLPVWAYSLNSKPFIITDYIYSIARQQRNYKKIAKDGYFTISFEILNRELGQLKPAETKRHTQFIINPILDSIDEIEDTRKDDIKITPIYDHDYKNAYDFLRGYLKVELEEAAHDYLTERAEARKKRTAKKKS